MSTSEERENEQATTIERMDADNGNQSNQNSGSSGSKGVFIHTPEPLHPPTFFFGTHDMTESRKGSNSEVTR